MSDVKWIKIATDIFDDDKILLIETLPDADSIIVIWFKLLCLAGKQNNSGVFLLNDRIAYTDKMLATIFRRKEATVQLALKTFEEFGMIEIVDDVTKAMKIKAKNRNMKIKVVKEKDKLQLCYKDKKIKNNCVIGETKIVFVSLNIPTESRKAGILVRFSAKSFNSSIHLLSSISLKTPNVI